MYTGSITIPRRVCVWVIYTGNRDLPRWSFSDVAGRTYSTMMMKGVGLKLKFSPHANKKINRIQYFGFLNQVQYLVLE